MYIDCIRNVNQGHIHLGSEDENGPVVAWLYPQDTREPETLEGLNREFVLAEGTLTEEDLVGPFEGESLDALAEAMTDGGTYVNVHSEQNPGGEIRGQIEGDAVEEPVEEPVEEEDEEPVDDEDEEEDDEPEEEEEEDDDDEEDEDEEPEEDDDEGEDDEEGTISTAAEAEGSLTVSDRNVDVGNYNPDEEYITIQNTGGNPIDMTGWYLRDRFDDGAVDGRGEPRFQFPDFVLDPGAEVRIWTGTGSDDDENLYWGLTGQNVWLVEGDVVILQDSNEDIAMEYEYGNPPSSIQFFFNQVRSLFA